MAEFDETQDFVVAGSGGGSMCAGLVLRAAGKSVLILEKTELIGGTTARSGGVLWIPNNPFMQHDGVQDSPEQAARYLDAVIGEARDAPGATPARRRVYLEQAPRMIRFLLEQGLRLTRIRYWPDYYDERPGGSEAGRAVVAELFDANQLGEWRARLRPSFIAAPVPASLEEMMQLPHFKRSLSAALLLLRLILRKVIARLTGRDWVAGGAALQGRMLQSALRAGVEIRTGAPVTGLIVEDGAVKGVTTLKDGQPWRIGARLGVLVNAGGFAHNQAMRDQYIPGTSVQWTMAAPGDTGEMLQEMARAGAVLAQMEERVGNQVTLPPGAEAAEFKPTAQRLTAAPHAMLVDQSGRRYMNEGGSYMEYCKRMLERHKSVPAIPSWAVFDSQYLRKYMLAGTMPGDNKPQAWTDSGYLKRAETLERLARQLGIEPDVLKATVERFNHFAAIGRDEDFQRGARAYDRWLGDPWQRPNEALGAIEQGPFYAVPVYPGDVGTYGGVVTDDSARVLRADGSPIPGLYATGVSTASVMGRAYPGPGSSVGPSFLWGYVAALHATGQS